MRRVLLRELSCNLQSGPEPVPEPLAVIFPPLFVLSEAVCQPALLPPLIVWFRLEGAVRRAPSLLAPDRQCPEPLTFCGFLGSARAAAVAARPSRPLVRGAGKPICYRNTARLPESDYRRHVGRAVTHAPLLTPATPGWKPTSFSPPC